MVVVRGEGRGAKRGEEEKVSPPFFRKGREGGREEGLRGEEGGGGDGLRGEEGGWVGEEGGRRIVS